MKKLNSKERAELDAQLLIQKQKKEIATEADAFVSWLVKQKPKLAEYAKQNWKHVICTGCFMYENTPPIRSMLIKRFTAFLVSTQTPYPHIKAIVHRLEIAAYENI